MTAVWATIAALTVITAAIKIAPTIWLGGRPLPARVTALIVLLAPALLAGLVMVGTFSAGDRELTVDERVFGVAAGAAVMAWRRNLVWTVVVAAATTAVARSLL